MAQNGTARQGTAARRRRQRRRTGLFGWIARAAALLVLLWIGGFVAFVFSQAGPAAAGTTTDGVAVLTGGPGRLPRGVEVLKAGLADRMLVSGVHPSVKPNELSAAADIPPQLFRCCVDLGFEADSTRSNAMEVAAWVERHGFKSIRLVTAGYHMPRARAEIEARLPPDVLVVPDGVRAGLPFVAMLVEYGKFQASWLLLRVRPA
jgi:uncharacterized SAM-binding protein YcdF (DUF218 family)